jgi:hypothetical protein
MQKRERERQADVVVISRRIHHGETNVRITVDPLVYDYYRAERAAPVDSPP